MARILMKRLTKRFGNIFAVNRIDLEIKDKEFLVLVGPSGCGKTTTLRMVAGLEDISDGDIYIGDRLVNALPPKDRNIAMVFQNYALYPHMNVFHNMAYGLKMRKTPKEKIEERVNTAAKSLNLDDLLHRKPKELSGGQRQRVALGRAIVRQPDAFLFDEPLSNLDAKLRVQMRGELKKLHARLQTTVMYVTHDQVEAMTMGDRVVVMKDGIIQQIGPPLELYDRPENVFVADFIGSPSMNFIDGEIRQHHSDVKIVNQFFSMRLPQPEIVNRGGLSRKKIILGIRPEHISLHSNENKDKVSGTITVIEPLGNEVIMEVDIAGLSVIAKVLAPVHVSTGDKVDLFLDTNRIHLFDSLNKERLN